MFTPSPHPRREKNENWCNVEVSGCANLDRDNVDCLRETLDSLRLSCSTVMSCTTAITDSLVKEDLLTVEKQPRRAEASRGE